VAGAEDWEQRGDTLEFTTFRLIDSTKGRIIRIVGWSLPRPVAQSPGRILVPSPCRPLVPSPRRPISPSPRYSDPSPLTPHKTLLYFSQCSLSPGGDGGFRGKRYSNLKRQARPPFRRSGLFLFAAHSDTSGHFNCAARFFWEKGGHNDSEHFKGVWNLVFFCRHHSSYPNSDLACPYSGSRS
jgi:hypothetical protein